MIADAEESRVKDLILRLAIALPISMAMLACPFLISWWIEGRFHMEIFYLVPLMLGLAASFTSFFAIAGKQMKRVDEAWKAKRRARRS